jgi:hypothetical protein
MTTSPSAIEALVLARHEDLQRAARRNPGGRRSPVRRSPVRRSLLYRLRRFRRPSRTPVWRPQTSEHGTIAAPGC